MDLNSIYHYQILSYMDLNSIYHYQILSYMDLNSIYHYQILSYMDLNSMYHYQMMSYIVSKYHVTLSKKHQSLSILICINVNHVMAESKCLSTSNPIQFI